MTKTFSPLPPVRRVVTAVDSAGHSFIAEDGPAPARQYSEARAGYCNANIWRTVGSPAPIAALDNVCEHTGLPPPNSGSIFRVVDFPPQAADPEELRKQSMAVFASLYKNAGYRLDHNRHPGMHMTETIDYAIVLLGEIVAVLDQDETVLRAGDLLVQRGTNHAWENRSTDFTRVAFILLDGTRTEIC